MVPAFKMQNGCYIPGSPLSCVGARGLPCRWALRVCFLAGCRCCAERIVSERSRFAGFVLWLARAFGEDVLQGVVAVCLEVTGCGGEAVEAWRGARGQKAFAGREARRAAVELHWLELSVPVPRQERRRLGSEPVRLTEVLARKTTPPSGAEALEWRLLTTLPVGNADGARRTLDLYALRWSRTGTGSGRPAARSGNRASEPPSGGRRP